MTDANPTTRWGATGRDADLTWLDVLRPHTTTGLGVIGSYDGVWAPAVVDSGTSTVDLPRSPNRLARWRSTLRALLHRRLRLGHCSMQMSVGVQFITLSVDGRDYRFDRQSGDYMP